MKYDRILDLIAGQSAVMMRADDRSWSDIARVLKRSIPEVQAKSEYYLDEVRAGRHAPLDSDVASIIVYQAEEMHAAVAK